MKLKNLAVSSAMSAGFAYFFHPTKGRARREWAKEKLLQAMKKTNGSTSTRKSSR